MSCAHRQIQVGSEGDSRPHRHPSESLDNTFLSCRPQAAKVLPQTRFDRRRRFYRREEETQFLVLLIREDHLLQTLIHLLIHTHIHNK